jgi:hypothetical protein
MKKAIKSAISCRKQVAPGHKSTDWLRASISSQPEGAVTGLSEHSRLYLIMKWRENFLNTHVVVLFDKVKKNRLLFVCVEKAIILLLMLFYVTSLWVIESC